ncbi:right-handed parallel beta-helix repeat-containing protein [Oceanithermus desulfurans]|uniref:Right handed beta helix domain-containing protein n=2 Tax=Oceanithermus desulfurans TaxID=227924 RepID=A0A511RJT8_9DEIN|nr:right-handed parallel beta-helix repeat-containing protein [Oceanithermus desulfurans]MBB6029426.1 hypothetical protein [Oceanithermus desulfurans]GEM89918.1 hypothetical protein ODE01S_13520 [Oceanithermus desulfurans NBRC 100063]
MKRTWFAFLALGLLAACQAPATGERPPGGGPPPMDEAPTAPPALGEVRAYATLHSAGFEWRFGADPEAKAACGLRYRAAGETAWREGWPPYRIRYTPPSPVAGKDAAFDGCAGSVFFLEPGATYELWLTLTGPEGLLDEGVVEVRTQSEPRIAADAPTFYVAPGSGGGAGTEADPYRGLAEAQRHARPGDVFLLAPGEYADFASGEIRFDRPGEEGRWVVWKAAGEGVVFTAPVRIAADYVWLEGVHLRGTPNDASDSDNDRRDWGLRTADAPRRVVIQRNTFTDFHYAIALNHGGEAWVIRDNVIVGDKDLRQCIDDDGNIIRGDGCPEEDYRGEGIELGHTSGHTVAYNRISLVGDGISYPLENVDIYGNEIFDVTDDGIEPDYGYANVRVWQNRITNARYNGLSFQPMNGGPWYFVRNQVMAPRESTLKLRRLSRVLLAHNLLVGWDNAVSALWDTEGFRRIDSLNNLYVSASGRYLWEQADDGPVLGRLDYDGFDPGGSAYAFKWGSDHRYPDLAAFRAATGLEPHGLTLDRAACFTSFHPRRPPDRAELEYPQLLPGCPAVDAGAVLPNLSGGYAGAAPDLGPYERGLPLPHYGPR